MQHCWEVKDSTYEKQNCSRFITPTVCQARGLWGGVVWEEETVVIRVMDRRSTFPRGGREARRWREQGGLVPRRKGLGA